MSKRDVQIATMIERLAHIEEKLYEGKGLIDKANGVIHSGWLFLMGVAILIMGLIGLSPLYIFIGLAVLIATIIRDIKLTNDILEINSALRKYKNEKVKLTFELLITRRE